MRATVQAGRGTSPRCIWPAMHRGLLVLCVLAASACQTPQWPVEGPIRSPYGVRGGGFVAEVHRGVDVAVPVGTRVRPILSGRVRFAGVMEGYGNVVWVDHSDDLLSVYAHLSEISVEPAQEITKATVLGLSGRSGNATGPHLHLEVWRWGREVDPVHFLGRPRR
ncbi:MAG: M23 family metallopeptidase [Gemmatimonadetes bacterium]|nr:M23 family metallopeptidase [Gemmatimonadota bacterium]MYD12272.1 M23 family metallopeptidase [Gemmatimonadota bacterium]